ADYSHYLALMRAFVSSLENFQPIGRNGLHRYNNQDHAMLTGMLAARNVVFGENNDLWSVNTDQEYHEEVQGQAARETCLTSLPLAPKAIAGVGSLPNCKRFLAHALHLLPGQPQ